SRSKTPFLPPGRVFPFTSRTTRSFCMSTPLAAVQAARQRNLRFFLDPRRWPAWPFLPLVRRCPGRAEELGLLFDALGAVGSYGLSATVFKTNLFQLPQKLDEFLTLPHETFDTAEDVPH